MASSPAAERLIKRLRDRADLVWFEVGRLNLPVTVTLSPSAGVVVEAIRAARGRLTEVRLHDLVKLSDQLWVKMLNGLGPIETQTRDQAVLTALAAFTVSAGLAPGARLPTERVLAETLAVSRGTIREALKRWQSLGIVEMRKGSGSYLLKPVSPHSRHLPLTVEGNDLPSLLHMLEVRRALEAEAAAICAERARPAEIALIRARLEAMEPVFFGDITISAIADWAFHRSIIETANNPLITQILDGMRALMHRFWEQPLGITDFGHASFPFHRRIYDAIAARDAEAARAETFKMLETVRADLLRGAGRPTTDV